MLSMIKIERQKQQFAPLVVFLIALIVLTPTVPVAYARTADEDLLDPTAPSQPTQTLSESTSTTQQNDGSIPSGTLFSDSTPLSVSAAAPQVTAFKTTAAISADGSQTLTVDVDSAGKVTVTRKIQNTTQTATGTWNDSGVLTVAKAPGETWTITIDPASGNAIKRFEIKTLVNATAAGNTGITNTSKYEIKDRYDLSDNKVMSRTYSATSADYESLSRMDYTYIGNAWTENNVSIYRQRSATAENYFISYTMTEKNDQYWVRSSDSVSGTSAMVYVFLDKVRSMINGTMDYYWIRSNVNGNQSLKTFYYYEAVPSTPGAHYFSVDFVNGWARAIRDSAALTLVKVLTTPVFKNPLQFDPKTAVTASILNYQQVAAGEKKYWVYWGAGRLMSSSTFVETSSDISYGLVFWDSSTGTKSSTPIVVSYPAEKEVRLNNVNYTIQVASDGKISLIAALPPVDQEIETLRAQLLSQVQVKINEATVRISEYSAQLKAVETELSKEFKALDLQMESGVSQLNQVMARLRELMPGASASVQQEVQAYLTEMDGYLQGGMQAEVSAYKTWRTQSKLSEVKLNLQVWNDYLSKLNAHKSKIIAATTLDALKALSFLPFLMMPVNVISTTPVVPLPNPWAKMESNIKRGTDLEAKVKAGNNIEAQRQALLAEIQIKINEANSKITELNTTLQTLLTQIDATLKKLDLDVAAGVEELKAIMGRLNAALSNTSDPLKTEITAYLAEMNLYLAADGSSGNAANLWKLVENYKRDYKTNQIGGTSLILEAWKGHLAKLNDHKNKIIAATTLEQLNALKDMPFFMPPVVVMAALVLINPLDSLNRNIARGKELEEKTGESQIEKLRKELLDSIQIKINAATAKVAELNANIQAIQAELDAAFKVLDKDAVAGEVSLRAVMQRLSVLKPTVAEPLKTDITNYINEMNSYLEEDERRFVLGDSSPNLDREIAAYKMGLAAQRLSGPQAILDVWNPYLASLNAHKNKIIVAKTMESLNALKQFPAEPGIVIPPVVTTVALVNPLDRLRANILRGEELEKRAGAVDQIEALRKELLATVQIEIDKANTEIQKLNAEITAIQTDINAVLAALDKDIASGALDLNAVIGRLNALLPNTSNPLKDEINNFLTEMSYYLASPEDDENAFPIPTLARLVENYKRDYKNSRLGGPSLVLQTWKGHLVKLNDHKSKIIAATTIEQLNALKQMPFLIPPVVVMAAIVLINPMDLLNSNIARGKELEKRAQAAQLEKLREGLLSSLQIKIDEASSKVATITAEIKAIETALAEIFTKLDADTAAASLELKAVVERLKNLRGGTSEILRQEIDVYTAKMDAYLGGGLAAHIAAYKKNQSDNALVIPKINLQAWKNHLNNLNLHNEKIIAAKTIVELDALKTFPSFVPPGIPDGFPILESPMDKLARDISEGKALEQKILQPGPKIVITSEVPTLTNKSALEVSYTVDGAAQKKNFTLVEGVNNLVIEAINGLGKKSQVNLSVTLDTIAPKVEVTAVPSSTIESSITVSYKVDGVEKQKDFSLIIGENTLVIDEQDAAGNKTHWEQKITRTLAPAPVILITSDVPALTNKTSIEVSYTVDGGAVQKKTFSLVEGINEIVIEATNIHGIKSEAKRSITRDTVAPKIEVAAVPAATTESSVTVFYKVDGVDKQKNFTLSMGENTLTIDETDAAGNKTHWEQKITRNEVPPVVIVVTSEVPALTNKTSLEISYTVDGGAVQKKTFTLIEGANTLVIEAQNTAGVKTQKSFTVIRDTIAPVIEVTAVPASTTESSIAVSYKVDGASKEKTFPLSMGENTLTIDETDAAGNKTHWEQKITRSEAAAPVIVITSEVPALTNKTSIEISYTVDGGAVLKKNFTLIEGVNTLVVEAENGLGVKSQKTLKVTRDTQAPYIEVVAIPASTFDSSITISYKVDGVNKQKNFALNMGENTLVIDEEDAAGNKAHWEQKITRNEVVGAGPAIVINSLVPAITNQTSFRITYTVDGGAFQNKDFSLIEGANILAIEAENTSGKTQKLFNVIRDTVAPALEVVSIPASTMEASVNVYYQVDGINRTKNFVLNLGENTLIIDETDAAGNMTHWEKKITRNEAPEPSVVITVVNTPASSSTFPYVTNKDSIVISYKVDAGAVQNKTFSLVEGGNTLVIEAENTMGVKTQKVLYVVRDTVLPVLLVNAVPAETELASLMVSYKVDGLDRQKTFDLRIGSNTLVIDVYDLAGNASHWEAVIVRTTALPPLGKPPVFNSIADQSVMPYNHVISKTELFLSAADPEAGSLAYAIEAVTKNGVTITKLAAMLLDRNTGLFSYQPQPADYGNYVITFSATDIDGNKTLQTMKLEVKTQTLLCNGADQYCNFLKTHNVAGNLGDYYDNRDGGHAPANIYYLPQMSFMSTGWAASTMTFPDRVVVGNSSTASGNYCGSNSCSLTSMGSGYGQYRTNAIYWYPEHNDHDAFDSFYGNTPYFGTSQGSSGSEVDEVYKYFYTLAAFRPEVKEKLKQTGLLMPAMQAIFRLTRVDSDEERYLTGEAHPTAFDNSSNMMAMMQMANDMTLDTIPALALLKVEDETFTSDLNNLDGRTEKAITTPASIGRIFRTQDFTKTMILSAEDSFDANGRPLQYEWKVLRGDAEKVKITKLNESGSRVKIEFEYQNEHLAAGSQLGSTILTNRIDVGLFVRSDENQIWSSPAFVTVYTPRTETRVYENGILKEVTYNNVGQAAGVGPRRNWIKDVYNADGGWVRHTIVNEKWVYTEFNKDGFQIVTRDGLGRPQVLHETKYTVNGTLMSYTLGESRITMEYADDADMTGRIATQDIYTGLTLTYKTKMIYDTSNVRKEVRVESPTGVLLAILSEFVPGGALLSPAGGGPGISIKGNDLTSLIKLAGSLSSLIPIIRTTFEVLALRNGTNAADYELTYSFLSASPETAPYQGYQGNLQMSITDKVRGGMTSVTVWTNRPYSITEFPSYPQRRGFQITFLRPTHDFYDLYDYALDGTLMGMRTITAKQTTGTEGGDGGPKVSDLSGGNLR